MKVLLIGFGSIGKRHYEVLSDISKISQIDVVTKQSIKELHTYSSLEEVNYLEKYDYFVIASETNKHFEQLKYLEEHIYNKIIFCEKPLFDSNKEYICNNNRVFVGYVLRFNPLIQQLRTELLSQNIISLNAKCGQYLPSWRNGIDYRKSYSAKKEEGGGVLLDLSHEIDYIQWLCGELIEVKSFQSKISDLEINSDDLVMCIGKTTKNTYVNFSIDYISKLSHRHLIIETLAYTYELDFINHTLKKADKRGTVTTEQQTNLERNQTFKEMHLDVLSEQKICCSLHEGLSVMKTIGLIQEQNI